VLRAMEEAGRVRRGYFVAGLGAAQFALPGAVDRLRALRRAPGEEPREPEVLALGAADPAQPYGAALPWPASAGRPARIPGAYVVLVDGEPAAFLERGARSLLTFPAAGTPGWQEGLVSLVKDGRVRKVELARIDGQPATGSPHAPRLLAAGFVEGYRGLVLRG
jgi:ATP-dependent Lhr-like helicase